MSNNICKSFAVAAAAGALECSLIGGANPASATSFSPTDSLFTSAGTLGATEVVEADKYWFVPIQEVLDFQANSSDDSVTESGAAIDETSPVESESYQLANKRRQGCRPYNPMPRCRP